MITMFHCTSRENLPGILKQGLLPFKPDEVVNAQKGVYLSKSPFEWMHWATDKSKYAGALIEVDITGLELEANIGFTDDDHGIHEFIYWCIISYSNTPTSLLNFITHSIS